MGNGARMPPGQNMDDWLTCFRSGMWRLEYGFGFSAEAHKRYFSEFMPLLHQTKHEVLGDLEDESWYLVYVGTKPEARGKGYARALIESVMKKVSRSLSSDAHMIVESHEIIPNAMLRMAGLHTTAPWSLINANYLCPSLGGRGTKGLLSRKQQ